MSRAGEGARISGGKPMQVHICRHGQAEPTSVTGRDLDRPLSRQGRLQARYIARILSGAPASDRPRTIVASPAARTTQTAQAAADELGLGIQTLDALLPCSTVGVVLEALQSTAGAAPVLLVGHNPTVTALVSVLLHGPSAGVCAAGPALSTGQIATIEVGNALMPGRGALVAMHRYEPALV